MNRCHRFLCRSGIWKRTLERDIFPWVLERAQLGDEVLEIGPGPGLTTDLLRASSRSSRLSKLTLHSQFRSPVVWLEQMSLSCNRMLRPCRLPLPASTEPFA